MGAELAWDDLELLERIRVAGTLGGAARALGVDQTTASRRLAALERRVGASLFTRVDGRLIAAPPLAAIADRLRTMSELAALSGAILKDEAVEMRANVRVTSVGFLIAHALAPELGAFARENPGICIEFIAEDRSLSFEHREADIALRLGAAAEDSTRVRKLGDVNFVLCRPTEIDDGRDDKTPVVRYGESLDGTPEMKALDAARPSAKIAFRASRLDILMSAALAIGAEVMLPSGIAKRDSRFVVVTDGGASARRPVYLMVHPDRAATPSVATVAAWTRASFRRWTEIEPTRSAHEF